MASNPSLFKKPVFWVGVCGLAIAGFVLSEPESTGPTTAKKKATTKKMTVTKKGDVNFTKEDETAEFKPVNDSPRNAFVPIVARHSGIGSADGLANSIPSEMTGGEGSWVYTGTAETNGVPVALVENRSTGDAVFLKRGERWKSAYVIQISEYSIILRGPNGTRTLGLVDENLQRTGTSVAQAGSQGFSPARVDVPQNMRGPIGGRNPNGLTASPDSRLGQNNNPGLPGNEIANEN